MNETTAQTAVTLANCTHKVEKKCCFRSTRWSLLLEAHFFLPEVGSDVSFASLALSLLISSAPGGGQFFAMECVLFFHQMQRAEVESAHGEKRARGACKIFYLALSSP